MQSHVWRYPAEYGKPLRIFLCSDLHIGHVCCDTNRIKREFQRAAEWGAPIVINGDVFDSVTTGDKRYTPGQTVRKISEARDALKATVECGLEVLAPFAKHIRIIGVGNHEEAWVKYRQSDPVGQLIDRLNTEHGGNVQPGTGEPWIDPGIKHGGIHGFVTVYLDIPSGKGKPLSLRHTLLYHHGVGGDSPVTKGTIDINRVYVKFDCDTYTFGHKHNKMLLEDVRVSVMPTGRIVHKQRVAFQTGSYFRNIRQTDQSDPWAFSYAESAQHGGKPFGGFFLCLTPERTDGNWRIRQDYHSALMPT